MNRRHLVTIHVRTPDTPTRRNPKAWPVAYVRKFWTRRNAERFAVRHRHPSFHAAVTRLP